MSTWGIQHKVAFHDGDIDGFDALVQCGEIALRGSNSWIMNSTRKITRLTTEKSERPSRQGFVARPCGIPRQSTANRHIESPTKYHELEPLERARWTLDELPKTKSNNRLRYIFTHSTLLAMDDLVQKCTGDSMESIVYCHKRSSQSCAQYSFRQCGLLSRVGKRGRDRGNELHGTLSLSR